MPKKNLIIAGVIVVILLILGAVAFMTMSKKTTSGLNEEQMESKTGQSEEVSPTKASIKSLLGGGKNTTCTISYPENGGKGTIFVADKKMRADFNFVVDGKETDSHMIQDGEFAYYWSGSAGTKMSLDAISASPVAGATPTTTQGADLDKQADLNCSNWSVDGSKFTVPTDVKFTDLSAMMQQTQTQTQTGTSSQSYCASITDAQAKAACVKATTGH